jgi:cation transport ATPase
MNEPTPDLSYTVEGMTCNNCVAHVQQALAPFARTVEVLLHPPAVRLHHPHSSTEQLQAALSGTRYRLVAQKPLHPTEPRARATGSLARWYNTYKPLFLLLLFIASGSAALVWQQTGDIGWHEWMRYYMAGFFISFAFFKLLDVAAFANAYASYDLLATRWRGWGFLFPFVELGLGAAYLLHWQPVWTNGVTLVVTAFSALGVLRAVVNKTSIQCACLGTVFNLPMSTVTLVENLSMAIMAASML